MLKLIVILSKYTEKDKMAFHSGQHQHSKTVLLLGNKLFFSFSEFQNIYRYLQMSYVTNYIIIKSDTTSD